MGRYDFRPTRVYQTASELLRSGRIKHEPRWLRAVSDNIPPHILTRSQPVQHTGYGKVKSGKKSKKLYRPQKITYPEDKMRNEFFTDHPWELARPRIVIEGRRLDGGEDWERVRPEGLALQPENVIRRQLWLIEHEGQDPRTAYNTARREFYRQRMREDIERKVAKEEAMHVGAYFAESTISWGKKLEDRKQHGFNQWAVRIMNKIEMAKQSLEVGVGDASVAGSAEEQIVNNDTSDLDPADIEQPAQGGEGAERAEVEGSGETIQHTPFQVPDGGAATLRI